MTNEKDPFENEVSRVKHNLNSGRMRGSIDFTGEPEAYEQNGNVYVEVECTSAERAQQVLEHLRKKDYEFFVNAKVKNPSTDSVYAYIVAHNESLN